MFLWNIWTALFEKELWKVQPTFKSREFPSFLWAQMSFPIWWESLNYCMKRRRFPSFQKSRDFPSFFWPQKRVLRPALNHIKFGLYFFDEAAHTVFESWKERGKKAKSPMPSTSVSIPFVVAAHTDTAKKPLTPWLPVICSIFLSLNSSVFVFHHSPFTVVPNYKSLWTAPVLEPKVNPTVTRARSTPYCCKLRPDILF